jgi:hypothetical protein
MASATGGSWAPAKGVQFFGFADPSWGSRDAFALALAYTDGERVIVGVVRGVGGSLQPDGHGQ